MAKPPAPLVAVALLTVLAVGILPQCATAAQLSSLPGWTVTIGELVRLSGRNCTGGSALYCDSCDMTVNFGFEVDNWGHLSWNCTTQRAGRIGRCVTCLLPDRKVARLLNVDGHATCEQSVANALIEQALSEFRSLRELSRADCDDRALDSRYNLMLANAVVQAFAAPVRNQTDVCRRDSDCRDEKVCFETKCKVPKISTPVWHTLVIAAAAGAFATIAVLGCILLFCCWRRKKNEDFHSDVSLSETDIESTPTSAEFVEVRESIEFSPTVIKMPSRSAIPRNFCTIPSQNSAFSRIESFNTS